MGLSASKELPVAQQQLKRLTEELRIAKQAAESASGKAAEAAKFQDKVATLKTQLFDSKSELEKISADLRLAKASSVQAQRKTAILMSEQEKIKKREEEIEIERQNLAVLREASKVLESAEHPTYGKLIADLGYKKVYCANAITLLAQTQVWKKQRAFRQKRSEKIAANKLSSGVNGWPGTISVVDSDSGNPLVIDGQHRLGACALLRSSKKLTEALETVLVEVHPPRDDKAIAELFVEINKSEPVLNVDLPLDDVGASVDENAVLSGAAETLQGQFPDMFKESHNCRAPHVNIDVLRNKVHQAGVIAAHKIKSEDKLVEWLLKVNQDLEKLGDKEWIGEKDGSAREKALAKVEQLAGHHPVFGDASFCSGEMSFLLKSNDIPGSSAAAEQAAQQQPNKDWMSGG